MSTAPQPTWRITGGNPDPEETAAVMAVLAALLNRPAPDPQEEDPPTPAADWDRARPGVFTPPGTWRRR